MKIHHLGYIVKDIKRTKEKLFTLGFNAQELSGGGVSLMTKIAKCKFVT